ncbi:aminoglycoside N(6')-acetyltransferase type 1 [Aureimonas endophytica]|uniref:Aminoglycoside N(6')-acetyltransferase type 1 n=1 Tax=Aureimonas endophytica TaxID=2027858 RepID=A0A916ZD94_9HYPH|nr:aminoglycoside 6'-N-acetyltransferase [Aureimonas endophytica]GGD89490.1 aminoglycoside N(6')-acetyltransferase type 1 [Aureimonas endophytica]
MTISVRAATAADRHAWSRLRGQLWLDAGADHDANIAAMLARPDRAMAFLAFDAPETLVGFAEASLRHDYVNGCETSPVGFLEGIFVLETARRQGVAKQLCEAAAAWAVAQGCREFASDADIGNAPSRRFHAALGFAETETVVYFRKSLDRP